MKERPILFSGPMVQSILDGKKTQTRRMIRKAFNHDDGWARSVYPDGHGGFTSWWGVPLPLQDCHKLYPNGGGFKPPWEIGDRLWVRETWSVDDRSALERMNPDDVWYRASEDNPEMFPRWRPSIHMPRWASRITLEVTGIRVERLQMISREDAIAEGTDWRTCPTYQSIESFTEQMIARKLGMACFPVMTIDYIGGYKRLWESINGSGSWDANPWVWVIEFRMVTP